MEDYKHTRTGQLVARKYADILEKSRPQSEESLRRHPRMPLQNRAKIFAPFAALRGYEDRLAEEKQRARRVPKRLLTEEEVERISDRLLQVTRGMTLTVEYFQPDTAHPEQPPVGEYRTLTGTVEGIDPVRQQLRLAGQVIPLADLAAVQGEGLVEMEQYLGLEEP